LNRKKSGVVMRFNGERIKNAVFYGGLKKEEYELIQDEFLKRNRSGLRGLSLITVAYMFFMLLLSLRSAVSAANRTFFIMCLSVSAVISIVSWLELLKNKVITMMGVYLYLASLFFYGIAIGCTQRTQTSVSILIFIMVGPLIFYDKSFNMNCFILIFTAIFIYISMKIKEPLAAETDLINGITYGTMSCIINTRSLMMRIQRIWLKKKLEIMAEADSLTGLRNRNSFEQRLGSYAEKAQRTVACVYIDANGLHKLNNTQGHAAGDAMLQYLAEQMVYRFGREDVYRIGGDEFMIFLLR
jgi:diguanylate cyclase (GGDEF) domain